MVGNQARHACGARLDGGSDRGPSAGACRIFAGKGTEPVADFLDARKGSAPQTPVVPDKRAKASADPGPITTIVRCYAELGHSERINSHRWLWVPANARRSPGRRVDGASAVRRSNRLPRIRHRRGEAAIDRDRLAVDIGGVVAGEKKSHRREFMRLAGALQRIELADLVLGAALLGAIEYRFCHAGFDQAGTHRIDA